MKLFAFAEVMGIVPGGSENGLKESTCWYIILMFQQIPFQYLCDFHCYTFRHISLNVFQKGGEGWASYIFKLHVVEVSPNLILNSVFLVNVDGFQESNSFMNRFWRSPPVKKLQ